MKTYRLLLILLFAAAKRNKKPKKCNQGVYVFLHFNEMSDVSKLKLNVGGVKFDTTLETLTKYPGTMLARMFDDGNARLLEKNKSKNGRIFFDRDPVSFGALLEFLRSNEFYVPRQVTTQKLKSELTYWGFDVDDLQRKFVYAGLGVECREKATDVLRDTCQRILDSFAPVMRENAEKGMAGIEISMDAKFSMNGDRLLSKLGALQCNTFARERLLRAMYPPNGRHPELRPESTADIVDRKGLVKILKEALLKSPGKFYADVVDRKWFREQWSHNPTYSYDCDYKFKDNDTCRFRVLDQLAENDLRDCLILLLWRALKSSWVVPTRSGEIDTEDFFSRIQRALVDVQQLFSVKAGRDFFGNVCIENDLECTWNKISLAKHPSTPYSIYGFQNYDGIVDVVWTAEISWV